MAKAPVESKQARKLRLLREGRWKQYLQKRERLKEQGYSTPDADRALLEEYGPGTFNGRTVEVEEIQQPSLKPDEFTPGKSNSKKLPAEVGTVLESGERSVYEVYKEKPDGNELEAIRYAVMYCDYRELEPRDAPTKLAEIYLIYARTKPANKAELMTDLRRFGVKTPLEEEREQRKVDDRIITVLDRIAGACEKNAVLSEDSEESSGELDVA